MVVNYIMAIQDHRFPSQCNRNSGIIRQHELTAITEQLSAVCNSINVHRVPKKPSPQTLAVTLSNLNRF